MGVGRGHVTFFRILGPLHISGRVQARNFKFGMNIHDKNSKVGIGSRHVTV